MPLEIARGKNRIARAAAFREVPEDTLDFIAKNYGSTEEYLLQNGMEKREIESIRENLTGSPHKARHNKL